MFILVHLKEGGKPMRVNMHNVIAVEDGVIYPIGNTSPIYVNETERDMMSQMPYNGTYL